MLETRVGIYVNIYYTFIMYICFGWPSTKSDFIACWTRHFPSYVSVFPQLFGVINVLLIHSKEMISSLTCLNQMKRYHTMQFLMVMMKKKKNVRKGIVMNMMDDG